MIPTGLSQLSTKRNTKLITCIVSVSLLCTLLSLTLLIQLIQSFYADCFYCHVPASKMKFTSLLLSRVLSFPQPGRSPVGLVLGLPSSHCLLVPMVRSSSPDGKSVYNSKNTTLKFTIVIVIVRFMHGGVMHRSKAEQDINISTKNSSLLVTQQL